MRCYIRVIPRSSRVKVEETAPGEYRVHLTAPPVDGRANDQLVAVLAEHLDISKQRIHVIAGKTARTKIVDIVE